MATGIESEFATHLTLVDGDAGTNADADEHGATNVVRKQAIAMAMEQLRVAPLHSSRVRAVFSSMSGAAGQDEKKDEDTTGTDVVPQYGLLGRRLETYGHSQHQGPDADTDINKPQDNLAYTNTNAPWSTFICGSQGSGKSHTLSCILENALVAPSLTGKIIEPLTGLVLH